ncbi:MAG TPA: hypothetical protein VF712_12975 [Thermoleophilaceae bacterium]|jgi:hypothetical protein
MTSWEEALKAAAQERDSAERARLAAERQQRAIAADLDERRARSREEYIRKAKLACEAARRNGLPGAQQVRLRKAKKPLFRPQVISVRLLIIPGAASLWYRTGHSGPKGAHSRSLWIGSEIRPTLTASWGPTELIPHAVYERAKASREAVHGLDEIMDNNRQFNQPPETLVDLLTKALARWEVEHRVGLDLDS